MTVVELKYRLLILAERYEQLQSEIAVLGEEVSGADYDRLTSAEWHSTRVASQLRGVSLTSEPKNLVHLLEASIDGSVRARRLQEVVGAENNNAG